MPEGPRLWLWHLQALTIAPYCTVTLLGGLLKSRFWQVPQ